MRANQIMCPCCQTPKTISFFYTGLGIQSGKTLPYCKECCKDKLLKYSAILGEDAGAWVLMAEVGIPYLKEKWKDAPSKAREASSRSRVDYDPFSMYLKMLKDSGTIYQGFWDSDIMLDELMKFTKPSPHFFSSDDVTDQPEKVIVAELIREKLLRTLDKEVPHGIAIDLERFVERDTTSGEPIVEVEATVICEKESHKGIIIGKGGATLKKIGMDARRDIEEFFGIRANVKLWVKVKEDWRNRIGLIHTFGLDENK